MIDHLTLTVRDYSASRSYYEKVLAPLGYRVLMEFEGLCGFGDDKPFFWMKQGDPPTTPQHIAFAARRRADVDAFHATALAAGSRDNGAPGVRADYHPSYYAAFVFDPDGHNIEAVIHRMGEETKPARAAGRSAAGRKAPSKAKPKAKGRVAKKKAGRRRR